MVSKNEMEIKKLLKKRKIEYLGGNSVKLGKKYEFKVISIEPGAHRLGLEFVK